MLCHQEERFEHEIVEVDRDDVEVTDFPDRVSSRKPAQNDRFRQIHAGDDTDAVIVPHEKGIDVVVPHAMSGLLRW